MVGQPGFTGAKEDADGAVLRVSLEPCRNTARGVIANALLTTFETARYILERTPHYLLTVKGNQPAIYEQLRDDSQWADVAHT